MNEKVVIVDVMTIFNGGLPPGHNDCEHSREKGHLTDFLKKKKSYICMMK